MLVDAVRDQTSIAQLVIVRDQASIAQLVIVREQTSIAQLLSLMDGGCTGAEVAAITGQSRKMVAHYSTMANQRRLTRAAFLKWEAANGG